MFERWKDDLLQGTDRVVDKMQEVGAEARKQLRLVEIKKDRFLVRKELGELVYRLITVEGRREIETDVRVKRLIHQLRLLDESVRNIEAEAQI